MKKTTIKPTDKNIEALFESVDELKSHWRYPAEMKKVLVSQFLIVQSCKDNNYFMFPLEYLDQVKIGKDVEIVYENCSGTVTKIFQKTKMRVFCNILVTVGGIESLGPLNSGKDKGKFIVDKVSFPKEAYEAYINYLAAKEAYNDQFMNKIKKTPYIKESKKYELGYHNDSSKYSDRVIYINLI